MSKDILDMSDDEIMNLGSAPPVTEEPAPVVDPNPEEDDTDVSQSTDANDTVAADDADDTTALNDPDDEPAGVEVESEDDDTKPTNEQTPDSQEPVKAKPEDKPKDGEVKDKEQEAAPIDYKAAYDKIMGGFKANGKDIKLESIDEAVKLMQMGANYTKKLQALQSNLKLVRMLENNGLLSEDKLSYLIDLDKKNPSAIQKLLKDSNIDPMDIDTSAEANYTPGNHRVSDNEINLQNVLQDVASTAEGKQLVLNIHQTWDQPSKEIIWKDPNVLAVLNQQRESGIYDQITAEVEKRRMLGEFQTVPFLTAYFQVGQALNQQGLLQPKQAPQGQPAPVQSEPTVVATRVAQRKPEANGDKVKAAAPPRTPPKKVATEFNPLAMSDEEFEKNASLAERL